MEIWKDVPNYEGFYQVSNLGRVKSLKRNVWMVRNNCFKTLNERILKTGLNTGGYLTLTLNKNKKQNSFTVHQLVAMVFLNHIPCGMKLVVNHINFDRLDNRVDNLEIVTQRENANQKHLKSSSKYTGVRWYEVSKKWISQIYINGKVKYLGLFKCEYEAHLTYQNALRKLNDL
jgi:hypothetical protein